MGAEEGQERVWRSSDRPLARKSRRQLIATHRSPQSTTHTPPPTGPGAPKTEFSAGPDERAGRHRQGKGHKRPNCQSNDFSPLEPHFLTSPDPFLLFSFLFPYPGPSHPPTCHPMSERGNFRGRGGGARGGNANRGAGGNRGGSAQGGEKPKKENILDLNKYMDKEITVKFNGGREGVFVARWWILLSWLGKLILVHS